MTQNKVMVTHVFLTGGLLIHIVGTREEVLKKVSGFLGTVPPATLVDLEEVIFGKVQPMTLTRSHIMAIGHDHEATVTSGSAPILPMSGRTLDEIGSGGTGDTVVSL